MNLKKRIICDRNLSSLGGSDTEKCFNNLIVSQRCNQSEVDLLQEKKVQGECGDLIEASTK